MTNDTIGVGLSKDCLDVHRMGDGESRRFSNDRAGHRAFVDWLVVAAKRASGLLAFSVWN